MLCCLPVLLAPSFVSGAAFFAGAGLLVVLCARTCVGSPASATPSKLKSPILSIALITFIMVVGLFRPDIPIKFPAVRKHFSRRKSGRGDVTHGKRQASNSKHQGNSKF